MSSLISHMITYVEHWWYPPIELTNLTGTQFMDLNDDCLWDILKMVNLMDLCSLMELSKIDNNIRLEAIAGEIFSRKYKFCHLNEDAETYDDAQRLLTNFGPLISGIFVSFKRTFNKARGDDRIIFNSIIENCGATLESLTVCDYTFDANEATPVFPNLQKLDIIDCFLNDNATNIFEHCQSLVELSVRYDSWYTASMDLLFEHTFPELELFSGGHNTENFKNFIARHRKLKAINLRWNCDPVPVLPIIADHCKGVKKLTMRSGGENNSVEYEIAMINFSRLINLEEVMIVGRARIRSLKIYSLIQQINQLMSLKKLCFEGLNLCPKTIPALSKLKTLEILEMDIFDGYVDLNPLAELGGLRELTIITRGDTNIDLIHIISCLTDLEKLKIYLQRQKATIDKTMQARIADILSKCARPTFEIKCDNGHFRFTRVLQSTNYRCISVN